MLRSTWLPPCLAGGLASYSRSSGKRVFNCAAEYDEWYDCSLPVESSLPFRSRFAASLPACFRKVHEQPANEQSCGGVIPGHLLWIAGERSGSEREGSDVGVQGSGGNSSSLG